VQQVTPIAGDTLPAPTNEDQAPLTGPYLIGPNDKLTVNVFGVQELSDRTVQVDGSGRIAFPLAGELTVVGKTTSEVSALLTQQLAVYIRNPRVTTNVEEAVSHVITVDGQVREPGIYPVTRGMTLTSTIAIAKGTSEFAKLDDVVVFRTVDKKRLVALYNLKAIRRGNYPDPRIYAGDLVVVGDSPARRLFKDVLAAAPAITTPIIYLLR